MAESALAGAAPIAAVPARHADAAAWAAAPFDAATAAAARDLVARLTPAQRLWLSGFLAGSAALESQGPARAPTAPAVTILHGSQTGNAEQLAGQLAALLAQRHVEARVVDMLDCRRKDLESASALLVLVSTHGNGEPPDRAAALAELLGSKRAPRLENVRYSVLALGDSSYEQFCATGRYFDARLEMLGAERLVARADCDVDFAAPAAVWMETVAARLASAPAPTAVVTPAHEPVPIAESFTRKRPFAAPVLANHRLTARGSSKDVRHLELSLAGSGIHYEPGDALGIVPRNDPAEVGALLEATRFPADAPVPQDGHDVALRDWLLTHSEIGTVGTGFLQRYAAALPGSALEALAADELDLARYAHGRDLRDVVAEHPPAGLDPARFAALLKPLAPRLYSIASSAAAVDDEVHLTVGVVEYEARGRARRGVVSGLVAALAEGDEAPVYLHRNPSFRLPKDPAADIVMIGAGTGVAPFRAFLAEREAYGAQGRNWLLFGDRSFELDFLYQSEWLTWRKRGVLTRIDVAFSRDQAHKIYVQQRIREHGAELWSWLESGAHVYVCGDAARLAPDVDKALHEIARRHGGLDDDSVREHWLALKRSQRYQRDVY
jgi:sulfite reductase (NADPH) flavoprotein alpha-component